MRYILEPDGSIKATRDTKAWQRWMLTADRELDKTGVGNVVVHTVFSGVSLDPTAPEPLVYETTIRGGEHDGKSWFYPSSHEARRGHIRACRLAHGD